LYVGVNNRWLPASNVTQTEEVVIPPIPPQNIVTDLTLDNVDTLTLTQSQGDPQVATFTDITSNTIQVIDLNVDEITANTITATEYNGDGGNLTNIYTVGYDLYMFYNY